MAQRITRPRGRWVAAFGLVALVPLFVLAYLIAMNNLDGATSGAPAALQAAWWVCALGAAAAAISAGLLGGLARATVATVLIWGLLATGVYFLLGPTCPLSSMGPSTAATRGMPPIRLQETFSELCSVSGNVAGSVDARWVLKAGALATLLAMLGGLAALARDPAARHPRASRPAPGR